MTRKEALAKVENGDYLTLTELFDLIPNSNALRQLYQENSTAMLVAPGSSKNHQAWSGGYLDHVRETMNIACQLYNTFDRIRGLPFLLSDALVVMFLHDLEKPFKYWGDPDPALQTKEGRRKFRNDMIASRGILLSDSQKNALRYVEGVPDSEYKPSERTMGELAAFCHCCDILSARLWHDRGQEGTW